MCWELETVRLIEEQRELCRWLDLQCQAGAERSALFRADIRQRERLIRALEMGLEAYLEVYPPAPSAVRRVG